jgi:N-formylglutamate deformylase
MGITTIHSIYSRWVIDLNRDPSNEPLYKDGRIITGLCPTTTFGGDPLYVDNRTEVHQLEINRRLELYYQPYHNQIKKKLFELKSAFGKVLLWECHSIRQFVPAVFPEKFPDLILGTNDEQSASKQLIDVTLGELNSSRYKVNHNFPFKGGYITRHFGKPSENQHAMQLEMSKVNYMDDSEAKYDEARANKVRVVLKKIFNTLIRKALA